MREHHPPPHPWTVPLFATARGRVVRCRCCAKAELRFGNALLRLDVDELPYLLGRLREADAPCADPACADPARRTSAGRAPADVREATLLLGESGSGWAFTRDELAELHRLVAGALLLLAVTPPFRGARPPSDPSADPSAGPSAGPPGPNR